MTSPYINTKLFTNVSLRPDQMDNKIYINLKKNLEYKVLNKCYKHYGFITHINEIEYEDGFIEAENLSSSALFPVDFSCRLCKPLKNTQIICKVNRANKLLVTVENGPILVIITSDRLNPDVFFTDNNNILRYKKEDTSYILKEGDFVKVTIVSISFNHIDTVIKAIGYLENIATDNEIKQFYDDTYDQNTELVDYAEYAQND
jgi:DNA-directed RNA polymerase subunit E'/Rpb7